MIIKRPECAVASPTRHLYVGEPKATAGARKRGGTHYSSDCVVAKSSEPLPVSSPRGGGGLAAAGGVLKPRRRRYTLRAGIVLRGGR